MVIARPSKACILAVLRRADHGNPGRIFPWCGMTVRAFTPSPDLAQGCAGALKRMAVQAGGLKSLAHALGVGVSQCQRYGDSAAPDLPDFAQVCAATEQTGVSAAAELLAELAGGRFVPGAEEAPPEAAAALTDANSEASELSYQIGLALRDGKVSAAERVRLEKVIGDLEWALARCKGVLRKGRT